MCDAARTADCEAPRRLVRRRRAVERLAEAEVQRSQSFVVGGLTHRDRAGKEIGSVLLGVFEAGVSWSGGERGTGWSQNASHCASWSSSRRRTSRLRAGAGEKALGATTAKKRSWVQRGSLQRSASKKWASDGSVRHATSKAFECMTTRALSFASRRRGYHARRTERGLDDRHSPRSSC